MDGPVAVGGCGAAERTPAPYLVPSMVPLQDLRGEISEILALAEVLLACEGQLFEMHGSFAAVFGTLVNRIGGLPVLLGNEGGDHE